MIHELSKKIYSKLLSAFGRKFRSTLSDRRRYISINELLNRIKNESLLTDKPDKLNISIIFNDDEFKVASNENIDKLYALLLANCVSYISENAGKFRWYLESPRYNRSKVKIEKISELLLLMSDVFASKCLFEEIYKQVLKEIKNEGTDKETEI